MRPSARTRFDAALTVLFVAGLCAPACVWIWRGSPDRRKLPEERAVAPFPVLGDSLASAGEFPRAFEAWFKDRFGLRDELLALNAYFLVRCLGLSPTSRIVIGADEWIYLAELDALAVHRGLRPMTTSDLESWRIALEARTRHCSELGIEYVFAILPEKTEIYPEHLPPEHTRLGPTRREQLDAWMRARSSVSIADMHAVLAAEKARDAPGDRTYYRLGTHWTDRGAWAAYDALLARLSARHPRLKARPRESFEWVASESLGDTWAERLYLPNSLKQTERHAMNLPGDAVRLVEASGAIGDHVTFTTEDATAPRLLMLHDSFGEPLRRFLPAHFRRSQFEWGREFVPEKIAEAEPDVVLEILVERTLMRRPACTLPEQAAQAAEAFERSRDVLYRLDPVRDARFVASRGGVEATPGAEGLEIEWQSDGTGILLPAMPRDAPAVVRIELSVAAAGGLSVFYRTRTESEYKRSRSLGFPLSAGRNVLHVDLGLSDLSGPLLLRFGRRGEHATLHMVEARAVH
jgi:hypothetical protein